MANFDRKKLVLVNYGQKIVLDDFGRFWSILTKKLVLVDFGPKKLILVDFGWKSWLTSILAHTVDFRQFWPKKLGCG